MRSSLFDPSQHRQVFAITIPMTLSGLSTPLLGMVDTAVMGHLDAAYYLGAVAVGALVFSFLFWGFGFLRMGVTGLTAQAFGAQDSDSIVGLLTRGVVLACLIGIVLVMAQQAIIVASMQLLETTANVEEQLALYLEIRILSAPVALINYVLLGWFLGIQRPRYTLYLLLCVNLANVVLDVLFVVVMGWRVEGVAWATVCAEFLGTAVGLIIVLSYMREKNLRWQVYKDLALNKFVALFRVSGNIFIRTLCLISSFAFFTMQGAKFGEATLAANAVLMNFQTLMAHGLDGLAHAAEALVGKYYGKRDYQAMRKAIVVCAFWSLLVAIAFAAIYALLGEALISMLTSIVAVKDTAFIYLVWMIVAPLISVWGYLFDGIFVGASWSRAMRDTMLFSTAVFVIAWYSTQQWGNHGLWFSLMLFMLMRGISMGVVFRSKSRLLFG